jgi:hypothetical protein
MENAKGNEDCSDLRLRGQRFGSGLKQLYGIQEIVYLMSSQYLPK